MCAAGRRDRCPAGRAVAAGHIPATVTAYGQNNALGRTPGQELAAITSARQSAGDTVTYRFIRGDVIAVSGTTTTGTVFYRREVVYPAVMYALAWLYPTASRTRYDALVTETADSFVPGPVAFAGQTAAMLCSVARSAGSSVPVMTPVVLWTERLPGGPPKLVTFLPVFWLLVPGATGLIGVPDRGNRPGRHRPGNV